MIFVMDVKEFESGVQVCDVCVQLWLLIFDDGVCNVFRQAAITRNHCVFCVPYKFPSLGSSNVP